MHCIACCNALCIWCSSYCNALSGWMHARWFLGGGGGVRSVSFCESWSLLSAISLPHFIPLHLATISQTKIWNIQIFAPWTNFSSKYLKYLHWQIFEISKYLNNKSQSHSMCVCKSRMILYGMFIKIYEKFGLDKCLISDPVAWNQFRIKKGGSGFLFGCSDSGCQTGKRLTEWPGDFHIRCKLDSLQF